MTDPLSSYPDFGPPEIMPWDDDYRPATICPFSNMKSFGKPLQSLKSETLLAIRRECEKRNGKFGSYFGPLIVEIDEMLEERQDE